MKKLSASVLCIFGLAIATTLYAQAPVEDRVNAPKAQNQAQMKAEYARQERELTAERLRAAQSELTDATRAQQIAEQNLEAAKRRAMTARGNLESARLSYQQADSRASQAAAQVGQAWQK